MKKLILTGIKGGIFYLICVFLLLLSLLLPVTGWGATIVAKPDVAGTSIKYKTGTLVNKDDADGWTTGSDLETALAAANAGGTLYICNGSYSGTMIDSADLLEFTHNNQTIQGESKAGVILDGTGVADNIIGAQAGITGGAITTLTLKNASTGKYAIDETEALTITDVDILDCARGMYLRANAGGTHTRVRITRCTDAEYVLAIAGTVNPSVWNYCRFEDNKGEIRFLGAATATFNNSNFVGFAEYAFRNTGAYAVTVTFNNPIFAFNNLNGVNTSIIQTNGIGTWTFNNGINGDTALGKGTFLANSGGATVTYNSTVDSYNPRFRTPRTTARAFFFIDDTVNLDDWYDLADMANTTYGYPVSFAMYVSGTEAYSAADWEKLAGYISGTATGIPNEIASHGWSGVRLYTSVGDDAAGTVNALTAAKAGSSIVIDITRTDPADSSTWSGTLTLDAESPIDLASAPYDTMDEVVAYLAGKGVTVGTATGQIAYNASDMTAKTLCLKADTYNINAGATLVYDQTSLFVSEMMESKAYLESAIQTYIPSWTCKSYVWSGGNHGAAGDAYVMGTAGYSQARGANNTNTADYKRSALGMYRVGAVDAYTIFGTTSADITKEAGGFYGTLSQFGAVGGAYAHALSAFSLANWASIFDAVRLNPGVTTSTFSDAMDWVRANDDHVTDNISYACADETGSCIADNADYRLRPASPAINAGVDVGLTTDFRGRRIHGLPDAGAYEAEPDDSKIGIGITNILTE